MEPILHLYSSNALAVVALVLIGLLGLGVINGLARSTQTGVASFIEVTWRLLAMSLMLVMTFSTSTPGEGGTFPALHVSDVLDQLVPQAPSPTSSGMLSSHPPVVSGQPFMWPDWHDPVANILMTVPLATALALTWSKRRTVLAIALLSISIEVTQHFYGHGRTPQLSDVVLNTLGGVVGVGIAKLSKRLTTLPIVTKLAQKSQRISTNQK